MTTPTIPTGEQAERCLAVAHLLGVGGATVLDLLIHVEDADTPRPAALDLLDPSHDARIYRYVIGELPSLILPSLTGRTMFDGLAPAIHRCASDDQAVA